MLRNPPESVDVMLMEGTNVQAEVATANETTESELEKAIASHVSAAGGITLITYSSQNIDRLVTLYRAAKRTGKTLVVDLYTATMAVATGNPNIPVPGRDNLRVYVPNSQRVKIKKAGAFERLEPIEGSRIYPEALAKGGSEFLMTFRLSMARELVKANCFGGASAIWSMWPGYLAQESGKRYKEFLAEHHIPLAVHHASGHAFVGDLQRLAKAVAPKRLVPIHSFAPERFKELFENVRQEDDASWWNVGAS